MYIQEPHCHPLHKFKFAVRGVGGLISCHPEPQSSGEVSSVLRGPDKRVGTVYAYGFGDLKLITENCIGTDYLH